MGEEHDIDREVNWGQIKHDSSLVFGQTTPILGFHFLVPRVGGWPP